ncbi:MAG: DUF5711 family protein [Ruminococcus sp.]|nr:DUF5711 family protein [Ruminococcus sp.]
MADKNKSNGTNKKTQQGTKRAVHTDIKTVRKNERTIRTLKRILAALIVLFIGLLIYATYPFWLPKLEDIFDKPAATISNDGETESGNFPIEPDEEDYEIYAVKNNLVTADAYSLVFYDENGKERESYSHSFSNPVERISGKRVLVFDSGNTDFKVYNKSGEIYSKTADDSILTGAIGEDGTAAIVTTSDKYASAMTVYDKEGTVIYQYNCTRRIMSVSIEDDGSGCCVCTFLSQEGQIFSQVSRLDFSTDGEQMVSENMDILALDCVLNSAGNILVVGDTAMYTLSNEGEILSSYEYDGELVDYELDKDCSAAIIYSSTTSNEMLIIAEASAQSDESYRKVEDVENVKRVAIEDDRVIVLSSDEIRAYAYSATVAATAELDREYTDFVYINGALYLAGKHGIDKLVFEM